MSLVTHERARWRKALCKHHHARSLSCASAPSHPFTLLVVCLSLCAVLPIPGAGVTPEIELPSIVLLQLHTIRCLEPCSRRWQSPPAAVFCTSTQCVAETSEGLQRAVEGVLVKLQHRE